MKYIIVGLGNFGSSLATKLTSQGHEVIGIDIDMDKVERYKESISHTICIDSTSENAVSDYPSPKQMWCSLPLAKTKGKT